MAMVVGGIALYALAGIGVGIRDFALWAIRVPGRIAATTPRRLSANALRTVRSAAVLLGVGWMTGFSLAGAWYWALAALGMAFTIWFTGAIGVFLVFTVAVLLTLPFRRWVPKPESEGWPTIVGYALGGWVAWGNVLDMLPRAPVASLWERSDGPYLTLMAFSCAAWGWWTVVERLRMRIDPPPPPKPTPVAAAPVSAGPPTPRPVWATTKPIPTEPEEPHWSPEPVIGWREWANNAGILTGMYGRPWHSKTYEAPCDRTHPAPQWDCTCGVYAVPTPPFGAVVGRVELTGTVIEHEHGYRAERAKITHLWVPDAATEVAVRRNYRNVAVAIGRPKETHP